MSVSQSTTIENCIETEAGIITPNFFKGTLSIPKDDAITTEEITFAKALQRVLENKKYKSNIVNNNTILLEKFNLEKIAQQYLK